MSALGRNGALADQRANAAGLFFFSYTATTPFQLGAGIRTRTDTYTAVDHASPANRASARVRLRRLRVRISSPGGTTAEHQRFRATGFTAGRTLYAHLPASAAAYAPSGWGRLKGACRSLSARRRLFPGGYHGRYRIQFDAAPGYSRARPQQFPTR